MEKNINKQTEIDKLKKISNFLAQIEDSVEIEIFTNERYHVEEYYGITINENYVGINRTGFYDNSYWSLSLDSKDFSENIIKSIDQDDFEMLAEDYIREEGDITEAVFVGSGDGNYEINDSLDDHDFDQIPEEILDKESGEIDIEKFQDIYGSDYELKEREDYCGRIDSFSIKIDEENVNVNLNILY